MPDLAKEKLKFTIDLALLDQSRVYVSKQGKKLLEFECVPTPNGKYGKTHFLTQRATKEERLAKTRLPILGNLALAFPPPEGSAPASYQGAQPPAKSPPPRVPPTEAQMANQTGGDFDPPF